MASAAFAVPLAVLVVNDRDGVQHGGTLQLLCRAPAAPPGRPSSADLARLRPLMRALGDALAAQEEGLDPERLSRTYTALMAELQEVAGMGVHAVHDVLDASQKPSLVGDKAPTDAASSACDTAIRGQDIERALAMCDDDGADVALQPCRTDRRTSIFGRRNKNKENKEPAPHTETKWLTCAGMCQGKFGWSVGSQQYYHAQNKKPPRFCDACATQRNNKRKLPWNMDM